MQEKDNPPRTIETALGTAMVLSEGEQEPVAYYTCKGNWPRVVLAMDGNYEGYETPLYAHPAPAVALNEPLTNERKRAIIEKSELWDMHIHMGWYSVPSKSFAEKALKLIDDIQDALAHRDAQPAVAVNDQLLEAAKACEFDSDEIADFDEMAGVFIPMDTWHRLTEAIAAAEAHQGKGE